MMLNSDNEAFKRFSKAVRSILRQPIKVFNDADSPPLGLLEVSNCLIHPGKILCIFC